MLDAESSERSKYERIWDIDRYRRHSPGEHMADEIAVHAAEVGAKTFADFGCGTGRAALKLSETMECRAMYDIAENCLDPAARDRLADVFHVCNVWDLIPPVADFAVCTDVLEHIPTDHVGGVIQNLKQHPHGFAQIACYRDAFGRRIGETLHMTVEIPEWWFEQFGFEGTTDARRMNCYMRW